MEFEEDIGLPVLLYKKLKEEEEEEEACVLDRHLVEFKEETWRLCTLLMTFFIVLL